jgi:hypothetical protein
MKPNIIRSRGRAFSFVDPGQKNQDQRTDQKAEAIQSVVHDAGLPNFHFFSTPSNENQMLFSGIVDELHEGGYNINNVR